MPATERDKLQALAALNSLPSRQSQSVELDEAGYFVALEGVTRYGLGEAVKAILRGSLGHAFLPSPPELRMQCDKAMAWHEEEAAKIRRRERENAEYVRQGLNRPHVKTPQNMARVAELTKRINDHYAKDDLEKQEIERAKIRKTYGLDGNHPEPQEPLVITDALKRGSYINIWNDQEGN